MTTLLTYNLLLSKANILNTYLIMGYSYLVNVPDLRTSTLSGIQPGRAETFFLSLPDRIYGLFDHDQTACRWMGEHTSQWWWYELNAWQMQARLGCFGFGAKIGGPSK